MQAGPTVHTLTTISNVDALLQVFYVGIGFLAIYQWKYGSKEKEQLQISKLPVQTHLLIIISGLLFSAAFGYLFDEYTAAAATYLDSLTTVFSVIATLMLMQKIFENWIYWIFIDAVYVYLYLSRGGNLFASLFILYTIMAIYGTYQWSRNFKRQNSLK